MATNFPSGLDSLTNPTSTDALNSPSHADQHANVNDAVEALEAKVGVDGSAVTSSLDYKVTNGIHSSLNVDSGTLVVDATNNRVGVNTASPGTALDVVGTATVRAAATQDGVALAGRAGGTSSYEVTLQPTTLSADRTLTLPNVSGTAVTTGNLTDITSTGTLSSLTVTGDVTVDTNTLKVDSTNNRVGVNTTSPATALDVTGTITARTASTQDGVALAGRAGGSSTYEVTLTPTTLTADRTLTLPDKTGTVALTSDPGLIFITGVSVSSGTSTAISFNNCFSSTYDHYRILIDGFRPATAARSVMIRFAANGVDDSTANYYTAYRGLYVNNTSADTNDNGVTYGATGMYNSANNLDLGSASLDIYNPFKAERTFVSGNAILYNSNFGMRSGGFVHNVTTAYDGFTILLDGSGNITTIRVRVYGYRNS